MRLVCPNCGAQYEVPDEVIPQSGREVQCSNCGDTWFQKHPDNDRDLEEELYQPLDEGEWDSPEEPDDPVEERREDVFAEQETVDAQPDRQEDPDPQEAPEDTPQRRELDPDIAEILRQEAARESAARAAESPPLETQPDLGLDDPGDEASRREREARLRMARMRGEPDPDLVPALGAGSRRDLLPNIEEINSSLRKTSDKTARDERDKAAVSPGRPQRSRFARGFMLSVLVAVLLILLYANAGRISQSVPALGAPLGAYSAQVDKARGWLDTKMHDLMITLERAAGG